jgi:hypothetical protein
MLCYLSQPQKPWEVVMALRSFSMPDARPMTSQPTERPSQGNRERCLRKWDCARSPSICGEGRAPVLSQRPPIRGWHTVRIRLRGVERSLAHRQGARCHVLDSVERSRSPRHQQGVGHGEAVDSLPVRACRKGRRNDLQRKTYDAPGSLGNPIDRW